MKDSKNLPAMPETWVQSLGQEDPLEKEMATHSSILAWEIPWTEEPHGLQSIGLWCGRCSRLTTGPSGTRSGGLRKGQSPCEFLGGLSEFLSR